MRLRGLAILPFVFAATFVAVALTLEGPSRGEFVVGQRLLARTLAIIGCGAAALAFQAGDRLRHAWAWLGASSAMFLVRDLLRLTDYFGPQGPGDAVWFHSSFVLAGNAAGVIGTVLVARSWKVAARMGGSDRRAEIVATIFTTLLALAVAGPAAYDATRDLMSGESLALTGVLSSTADVISLVLIAPILLTAIHLRRGSLAWAWGLLSASRFAWLLYDAATLVGPSWTPGFPLHEVFRGLGETLTFSAGCAQAIAILELRRGK